MLLPFADLSRTTKGETTQESKGSPLQTAMGLGSMFMGSGGLGSLSGLFGGSEAGGLFGEGSTSNIYSGDF
jgi:hypothetical protein